MSEDTEVDFLELLFGGNIQTAAEVEAGLQAMIAEDKARLVDLTDATAQAAKERAANACPKCAGTGYIPHFGHRKGGECFLCGATGVFKRYASARS